MGGLVTEWLWPYKLQPTRFFKTPKYLVSDTRPWPYNRGNTVGINMLHLFVLYNLMYYFHNRISAECDQLSAKLNLLWNDSKDEYFLATLKMAVEKKRTSLYMKISKDRCEREFLVTLKSKYPG